jgi:hypothetical protein
MRKDLLLDPFGVFDAKGIFRPSRQDREEQERLQALVWRLRRLFEEAMGGGVAGDLARALQWLADHGEALERAVVAWADLIEELVQSAERQYGTRSGQGALKTSEVQEALRRILRDRIDLPRIPAYLDPLIVDVIVSVAIDLVVAIVNDQGMWIADNYRARPVGFFRRLVRWLLSPFRWFTERVLKPLVFFPLLALSIRFYYWLQGPVMLSPEVEAAVVRVQEQGFPVDVRQALTALTQGVIWIGLHRDQVVAGFRLVIVVVQEAEGFLSMTGPEKKRYARNLVWAVLRDLGFDVSGGLLYAVVDAVISASIEVAVQLANKRGALRPARAA